MTLDELIARLTHLRTAVGGAVLVAVHPSVFYSNRPTFVERVETEDVNVWHIEEQNTKTHKNVVVLK